MIQELGTLSAQIACGTVVKRIQVDNIEENKENVSKVKVLQPKALSGEIDEDALDEIYIYKEQLEKGRIHLTKEGDIIVKLTTPYNVAYITKEFSGLVVSSHCAIINNLPPEKINVKYLAYVLSSPYGKDHLNSMTSGTATAMLKVKDLICFPVPMVSLDEQEKLGELYMAFNRKKSLLRKMIENENMAQQVLIMNVIQREE